MMRLRFSGRGCAGGGYIFVHDFDNWDGIEAAVARFCAEYHAGYFCLTDRMSIVIAKPF